MDSWKIENMMDVNSSIWVFAYGSLTWKPDIVYNSQKIGHIKGYQRRFWQGNATHRGTTNKLGRVATLVKSGKNDKLWGVAYEVVGREDILKALGNLNTREQTLGGYTTLVENFCSRDGESKTVLVYVATEHNELYLGPCNMARLAMEVVAAKGAAGTNIEYVVRLAKYVRENIPEDNDSHLFTLEKYVIYLVQRNKNVEYNSPKPIIALSYDRQVDAVRT